MVKHDIVQPFLHQGNGTGLSSDKQDLYYYPANDIRPELNAGDYITVIEGGKPSMVGKVVLPYDHKESSYGSIRGTAVFISSYDNTFCNNKTWCYLVNDGKVRNFRSSNTEEIEWLNFCIDKNAYYEFNEFKKMSEKFNIGDYITILQGKDNWNKEMDKYVGKTYKVTKLAQAYDGLVVGFDEDLEDWSWCIKDKHFRRATKAEIDSVTQTPKFKIGDWVIFEISRCVGENSTCHTSFWDRDMILRISDIRDGNLHFSSGAFRNYKSKISSGGYNSIDVFIPVPPSLIPKYSPEDLYKEVCKRYDGVYQVYELDDPYKINKIDIYNIKIDHHTGNIACGSTPIKIGDTWAEPQNNIIDQALSKYPAGTAIIAAHVKDTAYTCIDFIMPSIPFNICLEHNQIFLTNPTYVKGSKYITTKSAWWACLYYNGEWAPKISDVKGVKMKQDSKTQEVEISVEEQQIKLPPKSKVKINFSI